MSRLPRAAAVVALPVSSRALPTGFALALVLGLAVFPAAPAAAAQAPAAQVADPAGVAEPVGPLVPGEPLVDRDFGVSTSTAGLDRQVEMYQWQRDGDAGYRRVWNTARIDSSAFDAAHANPPFLLDSQRWWSDGARVDGHPVDREVLQALGEWRVFRPGFSRLPLNMAATFQPEGDGLGSAENPLQPQVGDIRIRWRELVLPPLHGRVVFRDGAWRLRPSAAPGVEREPRDGLPGTGDAAAAASPEPEHRALPWWWLWAPVVIVLIVALRRRRRKEKT